MIAIRHPGGYKTRYLHLQKFSKGLRKGSRVQQGQVIGRVGSTGLATGPHLHFELFKNNRYRDPLRVKLPASKSIDKKNLVAYQKFVEDIKKKIGTGQLSTTVGHVKPIIEYKNQQIPRYFYGTAWKEEATSELVKTALENGFTAIDTANQRKHYFEQAVGEGIQSFLTSSPHTRESLFLQTKFTYARGQDHRKPYDENSDFSQQVADSFASSLEHLGTDYVDSLILHGPYRGHGIGPEDLETWQAMEKLVDSGSVCFLGISNVSAEQLAALYEQARIKPSFVQNRCFARNGWDAEVRAICADKDIIYQGFFTTHSQST